MRMIRVGKRAHLTLAALAVGALWAAPALAQPAPPAAAPPAAPAAQDPAAAPRSAPPSDIALPKKGPDPLAEALAAQPGGLTLEEVSQRAMKTRRSIRAKQADLR